jgi:hypothetical protein
VLERSCSLETFLDTLRRVVQRHYAGHWPSSPTGGFPHGRHLPG